METKQIKYWSQSARQSAGQGQWSKVADLANRILNFDQESAEGWFLLGLANKAGHNIDSATAAFSKALTADTKRYDAAIELAALKCRNLQNAEAKEILDRYASLANNSSLYSHLAGDTYSKLGLHESAWPCFDTANRLQPGVELFLSKLAACSTLVGKIDQAKSIYQSLLNRKPTHQRHHYALSRLETATDFDHVQAMKNVLAENRLPPEQNIFLYYAIAKELEDLEQWQDSFEYYQQAGNAAASASQAAGYRLRTDLQLMETIARVCTEEWLQSDKSSAPTEPTPIFVVGLPRTGTTLTERILASHSQVESADESFFIPSSIKWVSGVLSNDAMNSEIVEHAARRDSKQIRDRYLDLVRYRLTNKSYFVEKYPFNFLYVGFIAKAFPNSPIVFLDRNPMDACFAMYKQSYFQFAYTLKDLEQYYIAFHRLREHWLSLLGDRLIWVQYESLVADPELHIKRLLGQLGLEYEPRCLDFHLNSSASATASTVQIREKAHTRSIDKWLNWQDELEPLRQVLADKGILSSPVSAE